MDTSWIIGQSRDILGILLSAIGIYAAVILFTRISGLRTFAKISSFDFAVTVAIGSLIATTVTKESPALLQSVIALAALFGVQMTVAYFRRNGALQGVVDNRPLLLMDQSCILEENMKKANVTHEDILNKLREANVTQIREVKAVVMETTGDISVLHHEDPEREIDLELLQNVTGMSNSGPNNFNP